MLVEQGDLVGIIFEESNLFSARHRKSTPVGLPEDGNSVGVAEFPELGEMRTESRHKGNGK